MSIPPEQEALLGTREETVLADVQRAVFRETRERSRPFASSSCGWTTSHEGSSEFKKYF